MKNIISGGSIAGVGRSPSADVEWNGARFERAIVDEAVPQVVQQLDRDFKRAFNDNRWAWPFAPSPRDVVNTGNLRDSQELIRESRTEYRWEWTAPYAAHVFAGGITSKGTVLPPRDVPNTVLNESDAAAVLARLAGRMI